MSRELRAKARQSGRRSRKGNYRGKRTVSWPASCRCKHHRRSLPSSQLVGRIPASSGNWSSVWHR